MSQDPLTPGVSLLTYTKSQPLKLINHTVIIKFEYWNMAHSFSFLIVVFSLTMKLAIPFTLV